MADSFILLETGDKLLLETGDKFVLESPPAGLTYLLEDGFSRIVLEDGSGVLLLEDIFEIDPTEAFTIDTWEFDSPEPLEIDRDPITAYLVWQYMDQGMENRNKMVNAIRVTAKGKGISVQIHAASPGDEIDK